MPCNVSVRGAFQLTPSARRATATAKGVTKVINILIHALREESDFSALLKKLRSEKFQSTPSARRATRSEQASKASRKFQSTPSARRAT